MATQEFWQKLSTSATSPQECAKGQSEGAVRSSRGKTRLWMILDVLTIVVSVVIATLYRQNQDPLQGARGFWHGTLIYGRSMGILLALLCFFAVSLMFTSRRLNLYTPIRLTNILHEQLLSVQACLTSGLF